MIILSTVSSRMVQYYVPRVWVGGTCTVTDEWGALLHIITFIIKYFTILINRSWYDGICLWAIERRGFEWMSDNSLSFTVWSFLCLCISSKWPDLSICTDARGTAIQGLTNLGLLYNSSTISPAVGRLVRVWLQQVRNTRLLRLEMWGWDWNCDNISLQLWFYPLWNDESIPRLDMAQHLAVWQSLEWKATKCDHLIEQDTIAPDIRHRTGNSVR